MSRAVQPFICHWYPATAVLIWYAASENDSQLCINQIPILASIGPVFGNIYHDPIEHFQQAIIYFQEWQTAGFFEKIWALVLEKYNELEGIGWEWQSIDGCMIKVLLARESMGHNPTDREKMGTKRSVLTDKKGLHLSVVLSGANTHDIRLLEETLEKIVISRPLICEQHPQNLCLDAGYTSSTQSVEEVNTLPIFVTEVRSTKNLSIILTSTT